MTSSNSLKRRELTKETGEIRSKKIRIRRASPPQRGRPEGIPVDHHPTALDDGVNANSVSRLVVALTYADGVVVETIGAQYEIPRSTIYDWLDRRKNKPVADALRTNRDPGAQ